MSGSPVGTLSTYDWKKVGKGALMAALGAAVTYLVKEIGLMDFGEYQTVVAGILSVVANIAHKYLSDTSKS